jgi:hypothetical protein
MTAKIQFLQSVAAIGIAALLSAGATRLSSQQTPQSAVRISEHDLGGVVTGANGPEAGVRVIAETTGLPTPFAKDSHFMDYRFEELRRRRSEAVA